MHSFLVLMYLICHIYFLYLNFARNKINISLKNFGFTPVHFTKASPVLLSVLLYVIFFFSICITLLSSLYDETKRIFVSENECKTQTCV